MNEVEAADQSSFEYYLRDLGFIVREMALEAKRLSDEKNSEFSVGYLAGFHRVVSLMQQQGQAFGIPSDRLGLNGIDPDVDLT